MIFVRRDAVGARREKGSECYILCKKSELEVGAIVAIVANRSRLKTSRGWGDEGVGGRK